MLFEVRALPTSMSTYVSQAVRYEPDRPRPLMYRPPCQAWFRREEGSGQARSICASESPMHGLPLRKYNHPRDHARGCWVVHHQARCLSETPVRSHPAREALTTKVTFHESHRDETAYLRTPDFGFDVVNLSIQIVYSLLKALDLSHVGTLQILQLLLRPGVIFLGRDQIRTPAVTRRRISS